MVNGGCNEWKGEKTRQSHLAVRKETYFEKGEFIDDGGQAIENGDDDTIVMNQIRFPHQEHVTDAGHLEPHLQEQPRLVPQIIEIMQRRDETYQFNGSI